MLGCREIAVVEEEVMEDVQALLSFLRVDQGTGWQTLSVSVMPIPVAFTVLCMSKTLVLYHHRSRSPKESPLLTLLVVLGPMGTRCREKSTRKECNIWHAVRIFITLYRSDGAFSGPLQ